MNTITEERDQLRVRNTILTTLVDDGIVLDEFSEEEEVDGMPQNQSNETNDTSRDDGEESESVSSYRKSESKPQTEHLEPGYPQLLQRSSSCPEFD